MRIESHLPLDRRLPGGITAYSDDGTALFEPAPARGKADNGNAAKMGNPDRVTTLKGGDHPAGSYLVTRVQFGKLPAHSYGACFLGLVATKGDAYLAADNGRAGIGIHGGPLAADGSLRATEGCLRIRDDTAAQLGHLVQAELEAGRAVSYECLNIAPPAPDAALAVRGVTA